MAEVPTSVTHDQLRSACEALGLPASDVFRLVLDARGGVTAHIRGRDEHGRLLADRDGEPVVAILQLSLAPLRVDGQAGPPLLLLPDAEGVDALREYFDFATWAGASRAEAEKVLRQACQPGARITAAVVREAGDRLAELTGRRDGARARMG